jgi:peptide/nickel transport system permease protein
MVGYLIRRLLQSVVVVLLVALVVFILLRMLPGNPATAVLGPRASLATIKQFNHAYGFDKPPVLQYFAWLGQLLQGNLGVSFKQNQTVTALLGEHLPKTLALTIPATLIALVIAIPLGMVQAVRRNKVVDHVVTGLAYLFYATPPFFLGLMLILVFAVKFQALPAEGPQGNGLGAVFSDIPGMVLPVAALALLTLALFSRYMRSSVMDNITEDYVRTARAKGASERRILFGHVLRNALIPIATLLGLSLPVIFAGALITESVFNYPGMGFLFWQSAQQTDYPVLLAVVLVVGVATVVGSLLADIAYAVLDPRVRYVRS